MKDNVNEAREKHFLSFLTPSPFYILYLSSPLSISAPLCLKDLGLGDEVHKLLLTWSHCNPFPRDLHTDTHTRINTHAHRSEHFKLARDLGLRTETLNRYFKMEQK